MPTLPPADLLQATHRFPCPYMFKAIGRVEGGFAARIVAAVRDELGRCHAGFLPAQQVWQALTVCGVLTGGGVPALEERLPHLRRQLCGELGGRARPVHDADGQLLTGTLADYRMPTASDFPTIRAMALEQAPAQHNPLGAKGAGEGGIVPAGGVLANAETLSLRVGTNTVSYGTTAGQSLWQDGYATFQSGA